MAAITAYYVFTIYLFLLFSKKNYVYMVLLQIVDSRFINTRAYYVVYNCFVDVCMHDVCICMYK